MEFAIRPFTPADVEACGQIFFDAFRGIAEKHGFPPAVPSVEQAIGFMHAFSQDPALFGVVAEQNGKIVGSNFLWGYDPILSVGPISVDPNCQGQGIGKGLMQAVMERGQDAPGIRLLQDSFNMASLSLYASLGFEVKEPVVLIEGKVTGELPEGIEVRPLVADDLSACADLCKRVHGFERTNELRNTPPMFTSFVAVRDGRITGYASALHFWLLNHAVAEEERDLQALFLGAGNSSEAPLAFILPTRQADLFRWCLSHGMRAVSPMTLMAKGQYQEPCGYFLPSVGN